MDTDRKLAYEKCFKPVFCYYRPSEAAGLRPTRELVIAWTIAFHANAEGELPEWDVDFLAEMSRTSVRTFQKYVAVLVDTGWLIVDVRDEGTRVRIDPIWLKGLPPVPKNPDDYPAAVHEYRLRTLQVSPQ